MKKRIINLATLIAMLCISVYATGQSSDWFKRVPTQESGLTDTTNIHYISIADINNDGYPDIIAVYIPTGENLFTVRKPIRLYLNTQAPGSRDPKMRRFIDITTQSLVNIVPPDTGNNANCFTLADFNNDGNIDLVTGNYYHRQEHYSLPNDRAQIYLGDGTGNFTWKANNGLSELGLINVRALTALDYDRDGNLDLFIPTWFKDYTKNIWDHGRLLKGNGDGTFTDVTQSSGIGGYPEPMYGAAATDWNNDCYPDIFTAPYCRTGGKLFKNEGNNTFTNAASTAGYNLYRTGAGQPACTFAVIPEDVNNDGNMDMFLSVVHGGNASGQFRSTIAINQGPEHNYRFDINESLLPVSPPASAHRGDYDAVFLDFDNDGLKDLVMVQSTYGPNTDRTYFWHQQPDGTFKDATKDLGLLVPQLKNSLGIEAFDYDLDGDDDILILGAGGSYFDLWRNDIGNHNNWISVQVTPYDGSGINRSGIGARVSVYYDKKMQMREVMAGRGQHTGQQPFTLNFGLGNVSQVDSVVIRWPDAGCHQKAIYAPPVNKPSFINNFPSHITEAIVTDVSPKVFPNPTEGYVVIQSSGLVTHVVSASVTDLTGRTVHVRYHSSDKDKLVFDMGRVAAGIYLIHLTDTRGTITTHRIIKK